jgi:predicted porin
MNRKNHTLGVAGVVLSGFIFSQPATALELYKDELNVFKTRGWMSMGYINQDSDDEIRSVSSRFGISYLRTINPKFDFSAVIEYGIDPLESTQDSPIYSGKQERPAGANDDSIWNRLGVAAFMHDDYGAVSVGKEWSVYYDIAGKTDIFSFAGAVAAGIYNFGTDGGPSGTGRADSAIQYRYVFDNGLHIALQFQAQEKEIEFEDTSIGDEAFLESVSMDNNYGISINYEFGHSIEAGIAYNVADLTLSYKVDELSLDGDDFPSTDGEDDEALAFSVSYGDWTQGGLLNRKPGLFLALVLYQGENHEVDDQGILLDTQGVEFAAVYNFTNNWSITAGYNYLEEDDDRYQRAYLNHTGQKSKFKEEYYLAGVKYRIGDFIRIWAEYNASSSRTAMGDDEEDTFGLGVLVYFF